MMISDDALRQLLQNTRTIAIVGLSANETRPSYGVAKYLQHHGYRIIPVNPAYDEVLGQKSYPDLRSIPEPVDMVDIFRKPEDVLPLVDEAVAIGAKTFWMQLGVVNREAARKAEEAGLRVIMDRCIKIEHARLLD